MSQILRPGPLDIFEATQATRSALGKCTSVEALMHDEWAENRLLDFNLWAAGVGASSASPSNLDQRLANQPAARAVVLGLLSSLSSFIEDCVEIGSGANASISEDELEDQIDLDQNLMSGETNPFTLWSDDSDSDNSDKCSSHSDLSPLKQIMTDIESSINQLIRLGTLIRSSGSLARLRKADLNFTFQDYEHLNDEKYAHSPKVDITDLRALKAHLVAILFMRPSQAIKVAPQGSEEQLDFVKRFDLLEDSHRQTIDKLIFANLRRRNRFHYAKRHAEKLALPSKVEETEDATFTATDDIKQYNPDKHGTNADQVSTMEALKPTQGSKPRHGDISVTTPSEGTVDGHALQKLSQAQSQVSKSLKSVSLRKSGWPHPPRVHENRATFQCPCCYQTLAYREANQLFWRSHLSDDLYPFTCIFPDCAATTQLFVSRKAWKSHLRLDHKSSKYWECVSCTDAETSTTFPNREDFMEHMTVQHGKIISKTDVSRLTTICERTALATIRACPLCTMQQHQDDEIDPEALLDHVADHIHGFSMLSLPWLDTPPERTEHTNTATLRRVQTWLNEGEMGIMEELTGAFDLPNNDLLPPYFAESEDASSGEYREVSSPGSIPSFRSQSLVDVDYEVGAIHSDLMSYIKQSGLDLFYKEDDELPRMVAVNAAKLKNEKDHWAMDADISNLARLALHRVIFYCDDSTSMKSGTRWRCQVQLVYRMAQLYELLLPKGLGPCVQFINLKRPLCHMQADEILQLLQSVGPRGVTHIGTNLARKILKPWVYNAILSGRRLETPVIIQCFTDGCPSHESPQEFRDDILRSADFLEAHGYDRNSVVLQISQIGNDSAAEGFLNELRDDPELVGLLQCSTERLDEKYKELSEDEEELDRWLLGLLSQPLQTKDDGKSTRL